MELQKLRELLNTQDIAHITFISKYKYDMMTTAYTHIDFNQFAFFIDKDIDTLKLHIKGQLQGWNISEDVSFHISRLYMVLITTQDGTIKHLQLKGDK